MDQPVSVSCRSPFWAMGSEEEAVCEELAAGGAAPSPPLNAPADAADSAGAPTFTAPCQRNATARRAAAATPAHRHASATARRRFGVGTSPTVAGTLAGGHPGVPPSVSHARWSADVSSPTD